MRKVGVIFAALVVLALAAFAATGLGARLVGMAEVSRPGAISSWPTRAGPAWTGAACRWSPRVAPDA